MKKSLLNLVSLLFVAFAFASCSSDDDGGPVATLELGQAESRALTDMQSFDGEFFKACCEEVPNGNLAVSPLSARLFLSMFANSIEGDAVNEITTALNTVDLEAVNTLSEKLSNYLPQADRNVKVAITNSVWYRDDLTINKLFEQNAQRYYRTQFFDIDFTKSDAGSKVNDWVKKNTGGMIDKIVSNGSLENVAAIILNTLYYKGAWEDKFDKSLTSKETFHGTDKFKTVDMMHQIYQSVPYFKGTMYQAISLPMGDKNLFEAVFVLPDEGLNNDDLVYQNVIPLILQEQFGTANVKLSLPRFKLSPDKLSLGGILNSLGIKSIDSSINKLFEENVEIEHNIFQQTVIEVNEDGAEAAAVTGDIQYTTNISKLVSLTFDRPFVFFIKEKKTSSCLFAARVNQL